MEIFDARCRPPIPAFWTDTMYNVDKVGADAHKRGTALSAAAVERSFALFDQEMAAAGVTGGAVPGRTPNLISGSADNAGIFELCRADERFVPVPALTSFPPNADPREIADFAAAGAGAVVFEVGLADPPMYIDDPSLYPWYEACGAAGLPVYLMMGGNAGPDLSYCNPVGLDRVARDFPSVIFVAIHAGWPRVQETLGVAYRRTNVWLLPDHYYPDLPGSPDLTIAISGYLQDRFLFGTAYPYTPLQYAVDQHLRLPLSDEVLEKIMGGNARRLFRRQKENRQ